MTIGMESSTTAEDVELVLALLRRRTGIALEPDKAYLVDSRLLPVARAHGLADVGALVERVRGMPEGPLVDDVVDALTTNETSWLRDGEPFRVLVDQVLPPLMAARQESRTITVWCAACATGQEPYSVAMMLEDALVPKGWDYRIVATDVSGAALRRAKDGLYHQPEINRGLPAALLVRWFEREGASWRVVEEMRRRVSFGANNLVHDRPPLAHVDVVLMRNVLIYFDVTTRQRVLDKVRGVLAYDGVLMLGAAETTLGLSDGWLRTTHGRTTVNRVDHTAGVPPGDLRRAPTKGSAPTNGRAT
jgi:chemotaxis protein methyltransferase CheR